MHLEIAIPKIAHQTQPGISAEDAITQVAAWAIHEAKAPTTTITYGKN